MFLSRRVAPLFLAAHVCLAAVPSANAAKDPIRDKRDPKTHVLVHATVLGNSAPVGKAQTENPNPIRVESTLVLVPTVIFDKRYMYARLSRAGEQCVIANESAFLNLASSEPYLPQECETAAIRDLTAKDFRVFRGGVAQQVASVTLEPEAGITVRDNFGKHNEWSYTPRGKWSTADLGLHIGPEGRGSFYLVAYVPSDPNEGKCNQIKVEVDRPNAAVFARDEYCYTANSESDLLTGTNLGKKLESDLSATEVGKLGLSLQAAWFYTAEGSTRVEIALEFPWRNLKHEWAGSSLRAAVGVLGAIYRNDGTLAAHFSDLACCTREHPNFVLGRVSGSDKLRQNALHEESEEADLPSRYETQIDIPPGQYDLRVVVGDGANFGRAETALTIEDYERKQLAVSPILLCKRLRDASVAAQEAARVNLAPEYVRLVSQNIQVTPNGDIRFRRGEPLVAYFEVYVPVRSEESPGSVNVDVKIVDAKTGTLKESIKPLNAVSFQRSGSRGIPIAVNLAGERLSPGGYHLEVKATDSLGIGAVTRTAYLEVD